MSDEGYGHVVSLFLFASTIAYALSGFVADALGSRKAMALFVGWWSLAEAATAFATTTVHLGIARFCLGLGEPGLWVAAPKAVGETFSKEKRGLAIGIYTMGATVGAVVALPAIAMITTHLPWRSIFLIDGATGLLWLPFWFLAFRSTKTAALTTDIEIADAGVGLQDNESGLRAVLAQPATWKLALARGLTDPVWYFYLFWFPKYLLSARHMTLAQVARIGWVVYLAAGVGTIAGGLVSGWMIRRGVRVGDAYRYTMLGAALLMPFSPLCSLLSNSVLAIAVASLIALAHMAWLVTLTATIVEVYPQAMLGKAAGLIASGSGFGGMLSSELIAYLVTHHGYRPIFFLMAVMHPFAIVLLWKVFKMRPHMKLAPLLGGAAGASDSVRT
jgi:ACS family hexuronate transporter-like MFS transporter